MSEHAATSLTLSTRNVSADGATITPDDNVHGVEVTQPAALEALKAFARVPDVALVDVDAKIYLAGPRGKFAMQNVRGKLFVARVPESVNTAIERTAEEIVAQLFETNPVVASTVAATAAAKEAELIAEVERLPAGPRAWFNSAWLVAALAVATGVAAWFSFAPETPAGIEIIRDPARVAKLNADLNGRYGEPAATILVLDSGRLIGEQPGPTGVAPERAFEFGYHFGLRDGQVVVVVENGALLEPQPDKSMAFLDSHYPRLAAK